MQADVLRLAGLLAAVALATTRFGLLAHELIGHGGAALVLGGQISKVRLFWFGGGWIQYDVPSAGGVGIATGLGGIGTELLLGLVVWMAVRGPGLVPRLVRGGAASLVVHATAYFANAVFSGFGDGAALYHQLGSARVPIAIAAGVVSCIATFVGARAITRPLADTLPGTGRQRAAGFAIAALLAGGLHAGLTIAEIRLRRDATYARIMRTQRDRQIAIELSTWQQARGVQGATPNASEIDVERSRLERAHREFPFAIVLALAMFAALVAGIAASRDAGKGRIEPRWVARAAAVAAFAIVTVIVLGLCLPG